MGLQAKNTDVVFEANTVACYQSGMSTLKDARKAAGLSQQRLAELAGTSQPQIKRLEAGEREITREWAKRLAPHVKRPAKDLMPPDDDDDMVGDFDPHQMPVGAIPLLGEVAAGRYVEFENDVRIDFDVRPSPFGPMKEYPADAQFDLRVSGTSINKLANDGDYLRCVSLMKYPVEIRNDATVIFERIRDGGHLREVTAKRIRHHSKTTELMPYSDDPQWQTSILLPYGEHESEEGRIVALVIYVLKPTQPL